MRRAALYGDEGTAAVTKALGEVGGHASECATVAYQRHVPPDFAAALAAFPRACSCRMCSAPHWPAPRRIRRPPAQPGHLRKVQAKTEHRSRPPRPPKAVSPSDQAAPVAAWALADGPGED